MSARSKLPGMPAATHIFLQVRSLSRSEFNARTNLVQSLGKLAKTMVGFARLGNLFTNVCGKIFAALDESRFDADLCAQ